MKTKIFLISIAAVLFFFACNKDDNTDNNNNTNSITEFDKNFGNYVNRDFIGQVLDINNQPVENATVEIDTKTVQTDNNGVFIIDDAQVYERFAFIKVKKTGFIDGSRSLVPTEGENNIRIMLLPALPKQTIQSGTTTEVALPSGTKVVFDGAFSDESGTNYSGAVTVAEYHLTPSNPNINSIMPGMLYGANQNHAPSVLVTFGMMNVELRGSGGQKLQISKGHNAELTMKIDNSQLAKAPGTIPLWYFDEKNGYWIQEGTAIKTGDKYVGTVSHFSWWNCDALFPTVGFSTRILDSDSLPMANVRVTISFTSNGITQTSYEYTDSLGFIAGLIPVNQKIAISADVLCANSPSYFGPYSSTFTNIPSIVLATSKLVSTNLVGNFEKCDDKPVENGYVLLKYKGDTSIATVTNGSFSFIKRVCDGNEPFTLEAYDYENRQTSGIINYFFNGQTVNVGNIKACNAVTEFISYKIGNEPTKYIIGLIDTKYMRWDIDYSTFYIYAGQTFSNAKYGREFYLFSEPILTTSNSRGEAQIYIFANSKNYNISSFNYNENGTIAIPNLNNIYNLSKFGKIGDYIDATFTGISIENGIQSSISGVIHVKRDK